MSASLADVDAALFAALKALEAAPLSDAQPFAMVGRYAGEFSKDGLGDVVGTQYPAALLRFDSETGLRTIETIGPDSEDRMTDRWTVVVALEDPRSMDDAIAGNTGMPGALTLIGAVTAACNALQVDGLWHECSVRQTSVVAIPALIRRGVAYAYAVVLEAWRVAEEAVDPVVTTQPLTKIGANVNLQSSGDAASNPFDTFTAVTT